VKRNVWNQGMKLSTEKTFLVVFNYTFTKPENDVYGKCAKYAIIIKPVNNED
jgi:hypothetical protein